MEDHSTLYFIHPRDTKIYHTLREVYCWNEMKKDIAELVVKSPNSQQVNLSIKMGDLTQDISITIWKGHEEDLNMEFVMDLPHTICQFESI